VRIVEGLARHLLRSVLEETLDFTMGLRTVAELDPSLRFRPLYRSELVVAARKGHPLRNARSLAELAGADWLSTSTFELPGGPVERLFAAAGLPAPRLAVQCESQNTMVALLGRSDMLGILQRRTLAAAPVLQEIALTDSMPAVTAGIYTRADTPLTRVAAAMARAATSVARRLVA
jgi:DNA-binding transcriptional LysR family regulator